MSAKKSNEKKLIRILKHVPLTDQIKGNGWIQSDKDGV